MSRFRQTLSKLRSFGASLKRDESGATLVEFTLSVPFFVFLSVGGMETAHFVSLHTRISQMALMVADNAGRVRGSIDEADIEQVMVGARTAGEKIAFGKQGRVILSSLEPNGQTGSSAGQYIRWQRCFGKKSAVSSFGVQGDGQYNASLSTGMGPTTNKITAASGGAVMFVEIFYDFKPMIGTLFLPNKTLRYTAAYTVRERSSQDMKNASNIATANLRTCNRFTET